MPRRWIIISGGGYRPWDSPRHWDVGCRSMSNLLDKRFVFDESGCRGPLFGHMLARIDGMTLVCVLSFFLPGAREGREGGGRACQV